MIEGLSWTARLRAGRKQTPVTWPRGPSRFGKTVLARGLADATKSNSSAPIRGDFHSHPHGRRSAAVFAALYQFQMSRGDGAEAA